MKIDSLLAELSAYTGLPDIQLDDAGACRLVFDDVLPIDLIRHPDDENVLLLQTIVGTVPAGEGKAFYLRLLASNYLAGAKGRPILSLVPSSREIVLWQSRDVGSLEVEILADLLTEMVRFTREIALELDTQPEDSEINPFSEPQLTGMIRV